MKLGDVIKILEGYEPAVHVPLGWTGACSYRGNTDFLAFKVDTNVRIGDMLKAAQVIVGDTYRGWKGGSYLIGEDTPCYLVMGSARLGVPLTHELLTGLLAMRTVRVYELGEGDGLAADGFVMPAEFIGACREWIRETDGDPDVETPNVLGVQHLWGRWVEDPKWDGLKWEALDADHPEAVQITLVSF